MTRRITTIVLHCTDSNFGCAELVDGWHKERGFKEIGYHFLIGNGFKYNSTEYDPEFDGLIEAGRDINVVGAHVRGHNTNSVGIALVGRTKFSIKQLQAVLCLIKILMEEYTTISVSRVKGHRELDPRKTCPNVDVALIRGLLNTFVDFEKNLT